MIDLLKAFVWFVVFTMSLLLSTSDLRAQPQPELPELIDQLQPRMVKIFGAGGLRRLESWQSGFFISEDGLIATVWSYVLDQETTVVTSDGRRMTASLVGYHPQSEIALLKVDVSQQPYFNLDIPARVGIGMTALAVSNLYGIANGNESCSVQTGVVSAIISLDARRGNQPVAYKDLAIVLDAVINNPGAGGGAVTDRRGHLLGLIGRETKNAKNDLWLNYAIPTKQLAVAIAEIQSGKNLQLVATRKPTESMTLELLGIQLVPDVVARTPPFVDQVLKQGAAIKAGVLPDDLVVELNGQVTTSHRDLIAKLMMVDRDAQVDLVLQRGNEFIRVTLKAGR